MDHASDLIMTIHDDDDDDDDDDDMIKNNKKVVFPYVKLTNLLSF